MTPPTTFSDVQVTRIMEAIKTIGDEVSNVLVQMAEMRGTLSAYASGLAEERKAREAIGRKVDNHDDLLRGDGKEKGLIEKIGDAAQRADAAMAEVKRMRNTLIGIGSPIAIAVIVDMVMRLMPLLYGPTK